MPEFLEDPSVLTKDKLKSELLAHDVELPGGNPTKDVYVQLYLKKLTSLNRPAMTLDVFSSDEELPPPVLSGRSRSSGKKIRKQEKVVVSQDLDVPSLTDEGLRDELLKHGVEAGPIVASTRSIYERKLQKLLAKDDDDDDDQELTRPALVNHVFAEVQVNHNGNSESDLYSDKEDEVTPEPVPVPEPVPEPLPVIEPEPVPVVEKPVRSRGKTAVTTRTRSSMHQTRKEVMEEKEDGVSNEEPVLRVEHRSRRLSRGMIVPQDQSESDSIVSRTSRSVFPDHLDFSRKSAQPSPRKSNICEKEVPSPNLRTEPSKSTSLFTHLDALDPVTFSPTCHIPPITKKNSDWSVTWSCKKTVEGSAAEEESLAAETLNKPRQPKITTFMSKLSPIKTSGRDLSREAFVRPVEKIAASDQTPKVEDSDYLKELFPNDLNSPSGFSVSCRRPIRGAAGRPVKHSDLWNDENLHFSPKITKSSSSVSSYTESRSNSRVISPPVANSSNSSSSGKILAAAPPAGQIKTSRSGMSMWKKLLILVVLGGIGFLVYQNMETNSLAPFVEAAAGSNSAA